jgi:hypothetical protein
MKKWEVPRKENMGAETIFLKEEEEAEEVKSNATYVERQDTCLGNAPRERKKEE